jgi:hypothetical protein
VREACVSIVKERLGFSAKNDTEFRARFVKWSDAGGLGKGGFGKAHAKLGQRAWRELIAPLHGADFTNSNDTAARRRWDELDANAEARRKASDRRHLREERKSRQELSQFISGLDDGFQVRKKLLGEAIESKDPPGYLKRLPLASVDRICSVWWGREYAGLTGQKENPSRIAHCMIERGRHMGRSHNVLRADVKVDFIRIRRLDSSAKYNGGTPIWPTFKHPALC